jgi:hypothetical protein
MGGWGLGISEYQVGDVTWVQGSKVIKTSCMCTVVGLLKKYCFHGAKLVYKESRKILFIDCRCHISARVKSKFYTVDYYNVVSTVV